MESQRERHDRGGCRARAGCCVQVAGARAHTVRAFLLAADFHNGRVDVFDSSFHLVTLPGSFFRDRHLPKGYAPFNILVNDDSVIVTYAKQGSGGTDEVHGPASASSTSTPTSA